MSESKLLKSGEFLVNEVEANDIFIPEEFNEEQRMIAQTCRDFLEAEVYPKLDDLDKSDRELMKSLLKKTGELGLLGIAVPEEYGGLDNRSSRKCLLPKQPVLATHFLLPTWPIAELVPCQYYTMETRSSARSM